MDDLQGHLARLGLAKPAAFGFALAGGYALQSYGLAHRLSEDIDLFTDRWDTEAFKRAALEAPSERGPGTRDNP